MSKKSWHFWESDIWHKSSNICTATLRTVTSWSSGMWIRYGNTACSNNSSYEDWLGQRSYVWQTWGIFLSVKLPPGYIVLAIWEVESRKLFYDILKSRPFFYVTRNSLETKTSLRSWKHERTNRNHTQKKIWFVESSKWKIMIQPSGSVLCGLKRNPLKGTSTREYQLFKALHAADDEIISCIHGPPVALDMTWTTAHKLTSYQWPYDVSTDERTVSTFTLTLVRISYLEGKRNIFTGMNGCWVCPGHNHTRASIWIKQRELCASFCVLYSNFCLESNET